MFSMGFSNYGKTAADGTGGRYQDASRNDDGFCWGKDPEYVPYFDDDMTNVVGTDTLRMGIDDRRVSG